MSNRTLALAILSFPMALVLFVLPLSAEGRLYMALLVFFGWLVIVLTFRLANDPHRDSTRISESRERQDNTAVYIVVQRSEPSDIRHYHDHQHTHRHIVEHAPAQPWLPEPRPQTVTVSRPERRLLEDQSSVSTCSTWVPAYNERED